MEHTVQPRQQVEPDLAFAKVPDCKAYDVFDKMGQIKKQLQHKTASFPS